MATTSSKDAVVHQQALLVARSVLPAATFRAGSPPSGAFLTAGNRADAAANGLAVTPLGAPLFVHQPVQGVSAVIPAGHSQWWALADNGYGTRDTSADWQLPIYRMDLGLGTTGAPRVLETVLLSDPRHHVPWKTVCDPTVGAGLPPFSFNALPTARPAACGTDPAARMLTGFDFDPESIEIDRAGTFWIGDEFGPFVLHTDRHGRLLEAPIAVPGVKSPQNPTLDVLAGEQPTVAASRGLESLAIDPARRHLYPMFEGAVGSDDPQDLRILELDLRTHRFTHRVRLLRLEMPGAKVNLAALSLVGGAAAYPGSTPPTGTGGESAAELTAVNSHQFLVVERDSNGDGVPAPRFKKIFLLDSDRQGHGQYVDKQLLVDLMAVPDPNKVGGDGDFFRFPFNTIESVHVLSPDTVLTANDNNYPFSNARSRSRTNERTGPLAPDD
ncbi:MAG: esterase-like activity of phytase family protein, partial [Actinomycetes bacterium]